MPIANPLSSAAVLLGLTAGYPSRERNRQANRATLYVAITIVVTYFIGHAIMSAFGVTIPGLRLAGGMIVSYVGSVSYTHLDVYKRQLYDRAHSAFAQVGGGEHNWASLLAGADWLHVSGVTPALGQQAADRTLEAVRAARAVGVKVSFDGNFRPKLWDAWKSDPATILHGLMAEADILFASHRDIEVVLGRTFEQATAQERFRASAEAAFAAFPNLQRMAATIRVQRSVDHHALSAIDAVRGGANHVTPVYEVASIVDRIGTGDAFAAGVLHGAITGMEDGHGPGSYTHLDVYKRQLKLWRRSRFHCWKSVVCSS